MKFNLSSYGYFGYYFGLELYKQNYLNKLYTNLPSFKTKKIPNKMIERNSFFAFPYVLNKLNLNKLSKSLNWLFLNNYDKWVSSKLTKSDIFHCFSSFGLISHRVSKKKFNTMNVVERGSSHIIFQHDILKEEYRNWSLKFPVINKYIIEKEIAEYEECDYVTVQSSFAEKTFLDQGINKNKILKIPLGVDLQMFYPTEKKDNIFRVLYSGTFSVRKGSIYLLKALKDLKFKNFEFVFNGVFEDEIKDLIRPYSDIIKYVGTRPFNKLQELYSQASVFVLPTIEDGFAKVVTESMACGVPVIATKNCSAADIITDGIDGFIVPIRDSISIKEKIIYLYENPKIHKKMSENALITAVKYLNTEKYASNAIKTYENCYLKYLFQ